MTEICHDLNRSDFALEGSGGRRILGQAAAARSIDTGDSMNTAVQFRLKPLAACLALALALAPVDALVAADRAYPPIGANALQHSPRPSAIAHLLESSMPVARGRSLQEVVGRLAAAARAARPPAAREPRAVAVTVCDDDGPGSLRDALTNAASGDTIDLTQLTCSTISLTTGAIETTADDVTVVGPGRKTLTIDAGRLSGVINHYGTGTLTVQGVTLSNGYIQGYAYHGGACVLSSGNIELDDATVSHCTAYTAHAYGGALCATGDITLNDATLSGNLTQGHFYYYYYPGYPNPYLFNGTSRGGGAYAAGRFTISNSTITQNTATYNNRGSTGGGFASRSGGHLITGSTISGNYAWLGGGFNILGHYGGESTGLTVLDSTISGNTAALTSGGFNAYRLAYLTLHNSTVTANSAPYCGGVYVYYGAADIKSSIIAGNTSQYSYNQFGYYTAADLDVFASNATIDGEHNLVMTSNAPLPADTLTDDPQLLPLADNGGPTFTHALAPTSIAIDAGSNPDALDFDQRGADFLREAGAAADIGAFELQDVVVDFIFSDGFELPALRPSS